MNISSICFLCGHHYPLAIIMKYFSNAQVQVDKNVIEYLLKRVDRDYQNLYNILEKINILSLQRKSKITTHLIRDIMT